MKKLTNNSLKSAVFACSLLSGLSLLSGCATTKVLESGSYVQTSSVQETLVEDQVVAFGKPNVQLPNMPSSSVVIVGNKNSYVLSEGGHDLVTLLTRLDPKSIHVDKDLRFYSPKNDGYFEGTMKLSYVKLQNEIKRSDLRFFLQEGGSECSTDSDKVIGAQRFCFSIPIKGGVFPQVNNLVALKSNFQTLTKPYSVSIYTNQTSEKVVYENGSSPLEKLVTLPFAIAFDVISIPFLILE